MALALLCRRCPCIEKIPSIKLLEGTSSEPEAQRGFSSAARDVAAQRGGPGFNLRARSRDAVDAAPLRRAAGCTTFVGAVAANSAALKLPAPQHQVDMDDVEMIVRRGEQEYPPDGLGGSKIGDFGRRYLVWYGLP